MKKSVQLLIGFFLLISNSLLSQELMDNYWTYSSSPSDKDIQVADGYLAKLPSAYQIVDLNFQGFYEGLRNNTESENREPEGNPIVISLPTPEGNFSEYYISENSVISPEVRDLYTIKTYKGYSKDFPHIQIRCDVSEVGFHALIYNGKQSYIIEPYLKNDNSTHIVYYKTNISSTPIKCGVKEEQRRGNTENLNLNFRAPANLRTFRLAYVASGEYSQQYGGNPYSATNVLNSFASAVNMVNPIYEGDLGVSFVLVSTTALVFEDPATDPFDPFGDQGVLIEQNQVECDNALGSANYDIGHLLVWANTGGLASGGVVCWDPHKGEGFSGADASFTTLIVDYSCHEMGHQFNASHNFVSQECGTSTDNFRFEPGEGSSIMSYAGVCGAPASYQNYSNQYFHSASINVMNTYITTWGGCEITSTPGSGNSADPISNAESDITIPKETPFVLVGSATDGNDPQNQLTYLWEQYDGGGAAATGPPSCTSTDQPLFRYRDPVSDNFRIFPEMSQVLLGNNNSVTWEKLPCVARDINFNLIVRDNNINWGRTGNDQMLITVANTGPFAVTSPNGGETWNEASTKTVTWTVNGTDSHCANVDILLSTDGGSTFTVVASAVTNDGSQDITVPNGISTTARILVQCSVGGNFKSASTFFDISDANFTIEAALPIELVDFEVERYMDDNVKISWTTASEINNSHFEVERSSNGHDFDLVAKVESYGNSNTLEKYSIIDNAPIQGINYYRLKQIDLDGTAQYSSIRTIQFSTSSEKIKVYPNPAKDFITINLPESEYDTNIKIYDQLGRIFQELKQSETTTTINIGSFPNGVYYIEATSAKGNYSSKIIKGY